MIGHCNINFNYIIVPFSSRVVPVFMLRWSIIFNSTVNRGIPVWIGTYLLAKKLSLLLRSAVILEL